MTDIAVVASDNRVTARERRRQSEYREQVLGLDPGAQRSGAPLGSRLRDEHWRQNFLSPAAADYAELRAEVVSREGGQLEKSRLRTNMLSSMPLCFSIFGHLRAYPQAGAQVLGRLLGVEIVGFETVAVEARTIEGIECEWAPERAQHLADGTAFDAVALARLADGRRLLVAVETKYVDSFSRDPSDAKKDAKYGEACARFGMAEGAFEALKGHSTRQLLRNVLLTESVRRGGTSRAPTVDDAVTLVLARADDDGARAAVAAVDEHRRDLPTRVVFAGHDELAVAAEAVPELGEWSRSFRRRYVGE